MSRVPRGTKLLHSMMTSNIIEQEGHGISRFILLSDVTHKEITINLMATYYPNGAGLLPIIYRLYEMKVSFSEQ